MDPELLLQAVYTVLHRDPPAGLDADDVDSFFERNRAGLLQAVRQAFPVAAIEPAFTRLREEHRLARLVFDAVERHLASRGPASAGAELADLIDAIDDHVNYENRTLFPYLRGQLPGLADALDHASEEHEYVAEHLFALAADLRAGRRYQGPAVEAARHHLTEEEEQLVTPALAAGLARTPAGKPGRLLALAADIEALAAPAPTTGLESAATPTRWGGLRGRALQPGEIDQNTRVVTEQGEHGLVTEVHAIVVRTLVGRRTEDDVHYSYTLKLDSGRLAAARGQLYEELAGPTRVVPDVEVAGRWVAPVELWSQVMGRFREIGTAEEKANNARKPEMTRHWQQAAARARKEFLELYRLLEAWRWAHPDEPIGEVRESAWRRIALEAKEHRSEDETWELAQLRRLPVDWESRFKAGDRVLVYVLGPYGRQPDPGWTIAELRGHEAILSRGDVARAEPLWMLKPDDSAPLAETFTEPRYLHELAEEMLVQEGSHKPYPSRGAVARAVKSFLAENGLQVSTRVGQGSMVTSIDLHPPGGSWSPDEMTRLRALLPGLKVWNAESAAFEPWETVGESYDPYGDYRGKSAGLLIPVAHLPRFAAILAGAMKAEGQSLNQLGERRLAASSPARAAIPTGNRGGATAEQRAQAAEGCRDLDFELPGYGRIRVVCGEQGRRDVWHNVYAGATRYGFNGGRWARNLRPPEPVLAAIQQRRVKVFG